MKFDVVMGKSFPLDDAGYRKITGLYQLKNGTAEFNREDDLLLMKHNGQLMEGLTYIGNNSFEGGLGYVQVKFDVLADGGVKATIAFKDWDVNMANAKTTTEEGMKYLKYGK